LNVYKNFDENLLALLDKADPESLKVWELLAMDEVPNWTLEKLALLGDSAHPFLPRECSFKDISEGSYQRTSI
jgi:hypothetical protein